MRLQIASASGDSGAVFGCRTGVSLHSHTSYSRETLDFLPRLVADFAPLRALLSAYEASHRRTHGRDPDYTAAWWTPPLGPKEALTLERGQIEGLGLEPLVSLTDHDNAEAPLLLRVLSDSRDVPISLEWTVPWRRTFLHLGVHNVPPRRAQRALEALAAHTACPEGSDLHGILDWLCESPDTMVVLNHPYWDESRIGQELHDSVAEEFVTMFRPWIHGLELNGLRPWSDNTRVIRLAELTGIPAVAGGDRHGWEPNALLNVTHARTFAEFVEEIREDRWSRILLMPQYRRPMRRRVTRLVLDVLAENPEHTNGWKTWSDRVFVRKACGAVEQLPQQWGKRERALAALLGRISSAMATTPVRYPTGLAITS